MPDLEAQLRARQREIAEQDRLADLMSRPDSDFIVRPRVCPRWLWAILAAITRQK